MHLRTINWLYIDHYTWRTESYCGWIFVCCYKLSSPTDDVTRFLSSSFIFRYILLEKPLFLFLQSLQLRTFIFFVQGVLSHNRRFRLFRLLIALFYSRELQIAGWPLLSTPSGNLRSNFLSEAMLIQPMTNSIRL
jgi:hypothetical protein